jgi:hypothetical protein
MVVMTVARAVDVPRVLSTMRYTSTPQDPSGYAAIALFA